MTMKRTARRTLLSTALAAALAAPAAHATVGYFQHGYGERSKAMGGVGIAYPQDAIAAALNPAGMVLVGDRFDAGVGIFRPVRDTDIVGNGSLGTVDYDPNNDQNFPLAHFGYNRMVGSNMSFGVSIYGNGGMNTSYEKPVLLFTSNPKAAQGVDLMQLFVAPTLAWKFNDRHALGVSAVLAYQRFKANGLHNFANTTYSTAPNYVTNKGYDSSTGAGVRVGWIGQLTPNISVGLTYSSKIFMSKFDKYKGLFAEQGDFDIPANYGIGFAFKATDRTTVALDVMRILYSDVKAVGNPGVPSFGTTVGKLGASNGMGFGWDDITVVKLGIAHQYSSRLTLRAGFTHNTQPIPSSETLFNMLAPGVIENHLTLGATWKLANGGELTVSYFHAFKGEVNGSGSIPAGFGGGEANLAMYQDAIGISYGRPLQ